MFDDAHCDRVAASGGAEIDKAETGAAVAVGAERCQVPVGHDDVSWEAGFGVFETRCELFPLFLVESLEPRLVVGDVSHGGESASGLAGPGYPGAVGSGDD